MLRLRGHGITPFQPRDESVLVMQIIKAAIRKPPVAKNVNLGLLPSILKALVGQILLRIAKEVWAMKMEYWITNNDMNIWKVIQNGNSMKKTRRDRDERVIILPSMTTEEHIAVQRESKARTTLLQSIPDGYVADFHYMDDAGDIWNAVKARMQKILSQLNQLKAKPEDEDINLKFLRALPSSWSQVALTLKTKGGLELLSFEDLYYKLKTLEVDVKRYTTFSSSQSAGSSHSAFVSATSASKKMSYGDSPSYSSTNTYSVPSNSKTGSHRSGNVIKDVLQSFVADTKLEQQLAYEGFKQIEKLDMEEMDLKWKMAMLSVRVHKFEQKIGRKIDFDKKESARFNKKKTDHDGKSDGVIASKELGMIAGYDTEDAIEEGDAKIYNLITGADTEKASTAGDAGEFALIGVTSEVHSCPFGCNNKYNELHKQYNKLNEQNGRPLFNRFAKADSMKVVLPPLFGDYTSLSDHIDLDESQMSYGTKSSTSSDSNGTHLIKDCDFYKKQMVNKTVGIGVGSQAVLFRTVKVNIPSARPQPVPTVSSGWWKSTARPIPHFSRPTSSYFQTYTPCVPTMSYNHMEYGRDRWATAVKPSADTECLVLSKDFKLPDESMVVLMVPRKHNLYTINLNNLCPRGKQHKASYKAINTVSSISEPFQLLHMDLFGPTSIRSIDHTYYCLVITDDYSRFCWVFFLEHKDETYPILKDFINLVENQLNKKVKAIRCDNGIVFKNAHMIELCGSKGIKREYSNAITPQQNKVAERKNRTLIEAARTMLADSKLPTMFWTKAVRTACYVLNRVLVTSPQNKTPYALLTRYIPFVSHFKPFGCHVTILNKSDQLGKFDGKADEGYIVGYSVSNKAYRVYNVPNKRVKESMNLTFLEEKPNVQGLGHECAKTVPPGSIPVPTGSIPVLAGDIVVSTDDVPVPSTSTVEVSPMATRRINTIHPQSLIIRDPTSAVQTKSKVKQTTTGKYVIGTKWILKNKRDAMGIVVRNKARLVAQGHRQKEGINYDEVFAPVVRIEAIKLFLSFASYMGFMVYQMDVKIKALYGLHQAPRAWYATLSTFLLKHGYRRGTIDKTLFLKKNNRDITMVQVYVDDIIFRSTKKAWCDECEALMKGEFQKSAMGELTFFLGLQVQQKPDGIFINQDKYVQEILNKFDLGSVRMATTPYEAPKPKSKNKSNSPVNVHLYRSMIGSLMYLTASRPDIMFAVHACSRNQVTPTTSNLEEVKKIFKYLKGQPKLGLWYPKESPLVLKAYRDSDYVGANKDRKSTTDGCQFLGRRLISCQCKKQTIVATSSTEAEYVATANCCSQVF
nr:retrovirus-related Pol polyprotein from transposon TNT 1-94 [Tanacetum cinerariifolium]